MAIPYLSCMVRVGAFYHLPPRMLPYMQSAEGGEVRSIDRNHEGTADLGVVQVNTLWLGPF